MIDSGWHDQAKFVLMLLFQDVYPCICKENRVERRIMFLKVIYKWPLQIRVELEKIDADQLMYGRKIVAFPFD